MIRAISRADSPQENKALLAIALVIVMTLSAVTIAIPTATAQSSNQTIPSYTYINVSPNPAGVNQPVNIVFWLDNTPPQIYSSYYYGWNYTITITNPDGKIETKGPYESDPVGGWYLVYTPKTIGTYKFQANFLGATINITSGSMPKGVYTWAPSQSREISLTVQTEHIQAWPETPITTGYWSYPINAENRDWYKIAGNWFGETSSPVYFTKAPESSHVIWTKPIAFGGIEGEMGWGVNWYTGIIYENKFRNLNIINGRLFLNLWPVRGSDARPGVACIDMKTGQEIWRNDTMPQVTVAQVLRFDSGFQAGTMAYLWTVTGNSWQMHDAFTGLLLATVKNASGTLGPIYGPNGEILVYSLSATTNRLTLWNSTKLVIPVTPRETSATYKPWTTPILSWADGLQWNVSIPDVPGSQSIQFTDMDDGVIVAQSTITGYGINPTFVHVGYDTQTGQELWRKNWTDVGWGPGGPTGPGLTTFGNRPVGEGYYAFIQKETMQWHVVNVKTGQESWVTPPLNEFTNTDYSSYDWHGQIAYGKLLTTGYSGCVVAFDIKTGEHLWTFSQNSSGLMTPYGSWPTYGGVIVADNKVYFPATEHTPNTPLLRGYRLYCMDADTGKFLWEISGFYNSVSTAIAGGKLVSLAAYQNQIYCFDKGLSKTTITATPGIGRGVTIQGTVTDQSPGMTGMGVPAAGTPAVSDASMTEWMEYLYMQQPMPANATGVPVTIYVSDQTGNVIYTASATTDILGNYVARWTPNNNGVYTITAVFDGTNSYYSSTAETFIDVDREPAASPSLTPTTTIPTTPTTPATPTPSPSIIVEPPQKGTETTLYVGITAIIIVAAITAIALILRRRK